MSFIDLLHPLAGAGYQFWSGIGSDFGELAVITGIIGMYRRYNCHVRHCPRLAWHPHPRNGHPVCRKHHPHGRGITPDGEPA